LSQDLDIFVLAPTGRDGPLICDMLARLGFACRAYAGLNELCRDMAGGVGALILAEEALAAGGMHELNTVIDAQPPWSDIGLVLLTSNGDRVQTAVQAMLQRGTARSTILMERPVRVVSLASTMRSLLQSRRRQYEIRDYLEERVRSEERLRETQKLESLGVLAGGIAHDFNNLLTGVLGNASLALEDVPPGSHLASRLQDVVKATERAAHLTKQLLAYAGKGRFVVQDLDLSRQVREITELLQASIPRTVQLRLNLEPHLPSIEADSTQMQQVIMNLVINAAEAIPEEHPGTVLVATGFQDVDAAYIRTTLPDTEIAFGPYVTLEVQDTGVGISPDLIRQIFDPFFTTKFTGRGLGLAAVKGIVRGHKGAIKVYSTPGQGTTFKLLFPASGHEARKVVPRVTDQHLLSGSGTVLVIDDEEIVRRTAQATLERFGYKVVVAGDGMQGLKRFRELAAEIAVVLLDMTMPVMSGEETFRELRLIQPDVRVILSSGFNEVEAIRRFTGKGLAGFVQKPYSAARLARAIKSVLDRPEREI
jgi:signal transduction histidine kinase/CheY-like chemotaxis protein